MTIKLFFFICLKFILTFLYGIRNFKMDIVLPKIKGKASLYRSLGIIGTVSTLILSTIWILLCIAAIIYFFLKAPYDKKNIANVLTPFAVSFTIAYFNNDLSHTTESYLPPIAVCVLIFIYLILSINLAVASILTFKEFRIWMETSQIRRQGTYWSISAVVMGTYELIFAVLFFADFAKCSMTPQGEYVAAAAVTMAALSMKGFLMWAFHMALCITMIYIHFIDKTNCPV